MANRPHPPDPSAFIVADEMDELFGSASPNADRSGCPAPAVLAALSRRERPIDDPGYEHLAHCSPCYREFRILQDEKGSEAVQRAPRRARWIALAAAVIVLATGAWLYFRADVSPPPPVVVVADVRVELDLRPFTVSRSPQDSGPRAPLDLPRGKLIVALLLPAGSEPGTYEVRLLDSASQAQASASGEAEIRAFVTTLEIRIDLRAAVAGTYQLAVRRPGEEWRLFPARVR
jgi:hypothetical protein